MATVRRVAGPWAGLLAGLLLALTPVLTLMARVDDPDALLTLLLVAAAWSTTRALEDGRLRWALLTGALLGCAFLTKSLAAFLVLPGLAGAFLLAGPGPLRRRVGHLLAAGGALVVAGRVVAARRRADPGVVPAVGRRQRANSPLDLAFGYNGLGRLTGNESSAGVGCSGRASAVAAARFRGRPVRWLLPAAVVGLVAGPGAPPRAAAHRPACGPRSCCGAAGRCRRRVVFSFMQGTWHTYYTVELAPAVAALTALGATLLWRRHSRREPRRPGAGSLVTTAWAVSLVDRRLAPDGAAGRRWCCSAGWSACSCWPRRAPSTGRSPGWAPRCSSSPPWSGPAAWSVATAAVPHTGSGVRAGPGAGRCCRSGRPAPRRCPRR